MNAQLYCSDFINRSVNISLLLPFLLQRGPFGEVPRGTQLLEDAGCPVTECSFAAADNEAVVRSLLLHTSAHFFHTSVYLDFLSISERLFQSASGVTCGAPARRWRRPMCCSGRTSRVSTSGGKRHRSGRQRSSGPSHSTRVHYTRFTSVCCALCL